MAASPTEVKGPKSAWIGHSNWLHSKEWMGHWRPILLTKPSLGEIGLAWLEGANGLSGQVCCCASKEKEKEKVVGCTKRKKKRVSSGINRRQVTGKKEADGGMGHSSPLYQSSHRGAWFSPTLISTSCTQTGKDKKQMILMMMVEIVEMLRFIVEYSSLSDFGP